MIQLTELTMEAYKELNKANKVEQVSEPLSVVLPFGKSLGDVFKDIRFQAKNYPTASMYMIGGTTQTESGLVTPFVLYKLWERLEPL